MQVRPLECSRGELPSDVTGDIHPESGQLGWDRAARARLGPGGEYAVEIRARAVVQLLLDPEVRARSVEMRAGCGHDRAERVVGRRPDVVTLGPPSYLARLGDAAGDAEVGPHEVDEVLVEQCPKFPLAAELLSGGEGYAGPRTQLAIGLRALGTQRVFDEERPGGLKLTAQQQRVRRVETGVYVEQQLDVVADGVAGGVEELDRREDGPAGLDERALGRRDREPEVAPALPNQLLAGGYEICRRCVLARDVGLAGYPVAHLAA